LPPTDDAAGDFHEGFVDECKTLDADAPPLAKRHLLPRLARDFAFASFCKSTRLPARFGQFLLKFVNCAMPFDRSWLTASHLALIARQSRIWSSTVGSLRSN
jgi:hypothetical protein